MKRIPFSHLTIRQRLPLLICTLLLSVILVFGVISYLGVRKAAIKIGQDRLQTLSQQLSNMFSENVRSLAAGTYAQANRPSVKIFLQSNGKDSVSEVHQFINDVLNDSNYVQVQLLSPAHEILADSVKPDIAILPSFNSAFMPDTQKSDSGKVGKLYSFDSSIFYPIMAPVVNKGQQIGYMIKWRKMQASSKAVEQLSQLLGTDAQLYFGNSDGSLWTDMITSVSAPPNRENKNHIIKYTRSGKEVLASINPLTNSQWLISVEFPKGRILQTANSYLYWLLAAGTLLLIIGIFLGWLMSRNISRPLISLTDAASQIAAGNYSPAVLVDRLDEIGKLARSFNAMSVQVQNSQRELEQKADNYKLLFEKNPMPMWIMSTNTFDILDVNESATIHYGYSTEEFLKLNEKDIRLEESSPKFFDSMTRGLHGKNKHEIWKHKKKNGVVIMVDVIADDIVYKNQPARLILAHDVTEKLKAEAELIRHRIMQQEIITETTILVQEKEREEIGKELHDNINQILTSTKLYLELARSGNKELLPGAISKSYDNINLVIGEIRQLSKQLVRPAFDTSLTDSLKDMTKELQVITPIHITFDAAAFNEYLVDENIKLMIYRITQEQLNNILKHAAASEVSIRLKTDAGNAYLVIADNGVGFDMKKKSKGIGLRNIDHRVKFHKGIVSIHSKPGAGCVIEISVPFKAEVLADAHA